MSAAQTLAALRAAVARIEAEPASRSGRTGLVTIGPAEIDAALGGGLKRGGLHAIAAASAAGSAAATGFAAALAARAAGEGRAALWIRQDPSGRESGEPWPPGLIEIGFDPARLIVLRAPDLDAALKAAETGAGCRALSVAVIEPFGTLSRFDRTAGRRLALAARRSGCLALVLRVGAAPGPLPAGLLAADTRWRLAPLSSASTAAWGAPRALAELVRNRLGPLGRWPLEWDGDDRRFRLAGGVADAADRPARGEPGYGTADPRARLAESSDRPHPDEREIVPIRRAG